MSSHTGAPILTPLTSKRLGRLAGREDALFVEDAVVGQVDLEGDALDLALGDQGHGVARPAILAAATAG